MARSHPYKRGEHRAGEQEGPTGPRLATPHGFPFHVQLLHLARRSAETLSGSSRWQPEQRGGLTILLEEDNLVLLETPIPERVHCAWCGPAARWAGRSWLASTIRHFKAAHGKTVRVQIQCSLCCYIATSVQAAYFHQEKACPELSTQGRSRLLENGEIGRTAFEGDRIRLLYPPIPSQCPLVSWICSRTRADMNGTLTTGLADGVINHPYTNHNGIKVLRTWQCSVCHITGDGLSLHYHHRHSEPLIPLPAPETLLPRHGRLTSSHHTAITSCTA